jgi:hypothetical protein
MREQSGQWIKKLNYERISQRRLERQNERVIKHRLHINSSSIPAFSMLLRRAKGSKANGPTGQKVEI